MNSATTGSSSRLLAFLIGGLALSIAIVFMLGRVPTFGPNTGDISVWIPVHEWMKRDVPLYEGVWDHKDLGFFWFTQPFYELWSVTGLYIVGALSAVFVAIGAYLIVRELTQPLTALLLGLLAMTTFVAASTFLSTYTETLAIGLASLAVGLLVRSPLLGGFVFAASIAVKVSGAIVLLVIGGFQLLSASWSSKGPPSASMLRSAWITGIGVGVGIVAIVSLAWATDSLTGWLEIISYNREYAQLRGSVPEVPWIEKPGAILQMYLQDFANLGRDQLFFLSALALASGIPLLFWRPWRLAIQYSTGLDRPRLAIVLSSGFTLGALLVTLGQRPSWHHWQYAVAPLSLLMVVTWAATRHSGGFSSRVKAAIGVILLLLPLAVALHLNRSLVSAVTPTALNQWRHLNEGAVLTTELTRLTPGTSVAIFGINSVRADYAAMPEEIKLACRFFYQFDHLLPRYREEILSCQATDPDLVIVQSAGWADDAVRTSISSWLTSEYVPCITASATDFQLWAKNATFCPMG